MNCDDCDVVLENGEEFVCDECRRKRYLKRQHDEYYRSHTDASGVPGDMFDTGLPGGFDGDYGTPW
jgi:hypothetical protein